MTPRHRPPAFRHIEFLKLSEKRVLLIVVTADGDVQNRILLTERDYTPSELVAGSELSQPAFRRPQLSRTRAPACSASCTRFAKT